ncbi:MAG: hypothetical protein Q8S73_25920 [Deltaproteobacteria bacterium]|nr:hypothetical protein [Deltaproteobacteria bacterium]
MTAADALRGEGCDRAATSPYWQRRLPLSPAQEREQQSAATEHDPPMGRQLVHAHVPPPRGRRWAADTTPHRGRCAVDSS